MSTSPPNYEIPAYRVHAVQWSPGAPHPSVFRDEEVTHREDWYYHFLDGTRRGIFPGEWIVTHPDGEVELMQEIPFVQRYQKIEAP